MSISSLDSSTTDHGAVKIHKESENTLQRNDYVTIISQNVRSFSSEFTDWKIDRLVDSMIQNKSDVYCVQETGGKNNDPFTVRDQPFSNAWT